MVRFQVRPAVVKELREELERFEKTHAPGVGKLGFYASAEDWRALLAAAERECAVCASSHDVDGSWREDGRCRCACHPPRGKGSLDPKEGGNG